MALIELPINSNAGNYNFRTQLEGTDYIFRFHYSTRAVCWYMDVKDSNNNPLVMGIKMAVSIELLASFKHLAIPQGILIAFNLQSQYEQPTRNNFGTEIRLLYDEVE